MVKFKKHSPEDMFKDETFSFRLQRQYKYDFVTYCKNKKERPSAKLIEFMKDTIKNKLVERREYNIPLKLYYEDKLIGITKINNFLDVYNEVEGCYNESDDNTTVHEGGLIFKRNNEDLHFYFNFKYVNFKFTELEISSMNKSEMLILLKSKNKSNLYNFLQYIGSKPNKMERRYIIELDKIKKSNEELLFENKELLKEIEKLKK